MHTRQETAPTLGTTVVVATTSVQVRRGAGTIADGRSNATPAPTAALVEALTRVQVNPLRRPLRT
ncbi:MAG: hypothetical protein EXR78_05900 [Deltaproteobacteria bacterium]|nr:hypothetical protein [Deltaproteobacteria bacterium]